jgi:hypothetical protein
MQPDVFCPAAQASDALAHCQLQLGTRCAPTSCLRPSLANMAPKHAAPPAARRSRLGRPQQVPREQLHEAERLEAALAGQRGQRVVRQHLLLVGRVLRKQMELGRVSFRVSYVGCRHRAGCHYPVHVHASIPSALSAAWQLSGRAARCAAQCSMDALPAELGGQARARARAPAPAARGP